MQPARFTPFLLALLLAAAGTARGAIWLVLPDGTGDWATIQAAVDAAAPGDEIRLGDGTFTGPGNRDVDFHGKALVVRSRGGNAASCVIDCGGPAQGPHRAFRYATGEGEGARLQAVTIRHGSAEAASPLDRGGGVLIAAEAMPRIVDCIFEENRAIRGGAVYCTRGYASFLRCTFRDNYALYSGGAIACADNSFPSVTSCTFLSNQADDGGAISTEWSGVTVSGCTFARNHAWMGSSVAAWLASGITIENTIMAFSEVGRPVDCEDSNVRVSCSDAFGNDAGDWVARLSGQLGADGNIAADPLFCDLGQADLRLSEGSPCLPSGACERMGAWPAGCGGTPATRLSWGALKALYRP
jgi:predicted outer membrane repeat protein